MKMEELLLYNENLQMLEAFNVAYAEGLDEEELDALHQMDELRQQLVAKEIW